MKQYINNIVIAFSENDVRHCHAIVVSLSNKLWPKNERMEEQSIHTVDLLIRTKSTITPAPIFSDQHMANICNDSFALIAQIAYNTVVMELILHQSFERPSTDDHITTMALLMNELSTCLKFSMTHSADIKITGLQYEHTH